MRQLTGLVVGLMLIFCWAALIRSLRTRGSQSEPAASAQPVPLPATAVKKLPDRVVDSQIALVAFQNPAITTSRIEAIVDKKDENFKIRWQTSADGKLPAPVGDVVYLRSGLLDVEPGDIAAQSAYVAKLPLQSPTKARRLKDVQPLPPGRYLVFIAKDDSTADINITSVPDQAIQVVVPAANVSEFDIVSTRVGKHALFQPFTSVTLNLPANTSQTNVGFRVHAREGNLKALRMAPSTGRDNTFDVQETVDLARRQVTAPTNYPSLEAEYDIATVLGQSTQPALLPLFADGDTHLLAASPLKFLVTPAPSQKVTVTFPDAVQVSGQNTLETSSAAASGVAIKTRVQLSTPLTGDAGKNPKWHIVLLSGDRRLAEPAELKLDGGGNIAPAEITFSGISLSNGSHVIQAKVFAGDLLIQQEAELVLNVSNSGFRVTDISPRDFGVVLGSNIIRIDFSRPLNSSVDETQFKSSIKIFRSESGRFTEVPPPQPLSPLPAGDKFVFSDDRSSVFLVFDSVEAGVYRVRLDGSLLSDQFGNQLEGDDGQPGTRVVRQLGQAADRALASVPVTRGVTPSRAPHIEYPEFTAPRESTKGFNPSDKVETRVARLYFYRDAHRVAQILNRKVQSYNRQGVAVRRQLADKSRQEAEQLTTERMEVERYAVQLAQETRRLENELSDAQRSLDRSLQELQNASFGLNTAQLDDSDRARQQQVVNQLEATVQSFASRAASLERDVRQARDQEVAANERWQQAQRVEQLAKTEQFRLETAAAHEDPDTFAAGDPRSIDPVAQVSISVIGEGLLHLRGPLKGVNQVRLMIDQIDSPQGQVRVAVHSTQINGEEADKLEVVANRIQTYIDQARFLTVQSGEMLRKAVVHVAAARAEEARGMYPGATQAERDQLYLHSFFGRDFVDELRAMDSELLQTGNKLLSLHSMDVTSLSSALTLLAIANNGTRLAILEEFNRLLQTELAVAEQQYIHNGIGACTGGCKRGCKHDHHAPPVCLFAPNATFVSLRGFFDAQIAHDDTISPLQREMIRLAQILKARLITEMEYKQRVMERAVIEERIDDSADQQEFMRLRQVQAEQELANALSDLAKTQASLSTSLAKGVAQVSALSRQVDQDVATSDEQIREAIADIMRSQNISGAEIAVSDQQLQDILRKISDADSQGAMIRKNFIEAAQRSNGGGLESLRPSPKVTNTLEGFDYRLVTGDRNSVMQALRIQPDGDVQDPDQIAFIVLFPVNSATLQAKQAIVDIVSRERRIFEQLAEFGLLDERNVQNCKELVSMQSRLVELPNTVAVGKEEKELGVPVISVADITNLAAIVESRIALLREVKRRLRSLRERRQSLVNIFVQLGSKFERGEAGVQELGQFYSDWLAWVRDVESLFGDKKSKVDEVREVLTPVTREIETWVVTASKADLARKTAQDARRPLDHKKFLDMLIDDLEENYIELLEGTRAHTANIDNYLKRLTTSLDDDFNTQFYHPAFRLVREASQFKRVEFGQTETTNVLANNREFAKVSPSATMEFDLPKRDILIKEGIDSALAIYNDVGALVNDPNLLSLAKMQSGSGAADAAAGTLGGLGAVRNVLPGLNGSSAEQIMARGAGSGPEFESNVEKLIPDPAIYKFETGTGYEIRPVIAPDGQAVVFDFHYLYTTQIREPVRADEKHLGRVKQHFVDTDVQLSNFELREVSRYVVALKAERTAKGVPLLEDIPVVGVLWRPLPSDEKSLQQNIIMAQATIFPTLFDLMGLRWAPAVSDLDPLRLSNREYLVRGRHQFLENRIYDYSSTQVDEFLRIPEDVRRADLYRSQATISSVHPNGYRGPGLDLRNSQMREGYNPEEAYPTPGYIPAQSAEGAVYLPHRQNNPYQQMPRGATVIEQRHPVELAPPSRFPASSSGQPRPLESSSSSRQGDGWQYGSAK